MELAIIYNVGRDLLPSHSPYRSIDCAMGLGYSPKLLKDASGGIEDIQSFLTSLSLPISKTYFEFDLKSPPGLTIIIPPPSQSLPLFQFQNNILDPYYKLQDNSVYDLHSNHFSASALGPPLLVSPQNNVKSFSDSSSFKKSMPYSALEDSVTELSTYANIYDKLHQNTTYVATARRLLAIPTYSKYKAFMIAGFDGLTQYQSIFVSPPQPLMKTQLQNSCTLHGSRKLESGAWGLIADSLSVYSRSKFKDGRPQLVVSGCLHQSNKSLETPSIAFDPFRNWSQFDVSDHQILDEHGLSQDQKFFRASTLKFSNSARQIGMDLNYISSFTLRLYSPNIQKKGEVEKFVHDVLLSRLPPPSLTPAQFINDASCINFLPENLLATESAPTWASALNPSASCLCPSRWPPGLEKENWGVLALELGGLQLDVRIEDLFVSRNPPGRCSFAFDVVRVAAANSASTTFEDEGRGSFIETAELVVGRVFLSRWAPRLMLKDKNEPLAVTFSGFVSPWAACDTGSQSLACSANDEKYKLRHFSINGGSADFARGNFAANSLEDYRSKTSTILGIMMISNAIFLIIYFLIKVVKRTTFFKKINSKRPTVEDDSQIALPTNIDANIIMPSEKLIHQNLPTNEFVNKEENASFMARLKKSVRHCLWHEDVAEVNDEGEEDVLCNTSPTRIAESTRRNRTCPQKVLKSAPAGDSKKHQLAANTVASIISSSSGRADDFALAVAAVELSHLKGLDAKELFELMKIELEKQNNQIKDNEDSLLSTIYEGSESGTISGLPILYNNTNLVGDLKGSNDPIRSVLPSHLPMNQSTAIAALLADSITPLTSPDQLLRTAGSNNNSPLLVATRHSSNSFLNLQQQLNAAYQTVTSDFLLDVSPRSASSGSSNLTFTKKQQRHRLIQVMQLSSFTSISHNNNNNNNNISLHSQTNPPSPLSPIHLLFPNDLSSKQSLQSQNSASQTISPPQTICRSSTQQQQLAPSPAPSPFFPPCRSSSPFALNQSSSPASSQASPAEMKPVSPCALSASVIPDCRIPPPWLTTASSSSLVFQPRNPRNSSYSSSTFLNTLFAPLAPPLPPLSSSSDTADMSPPMPFTSQHDGPASSDENYLSFQLSSSLPVCEPPPSHAPRSQFNLEHTPLATENSARNSMSH